MLTLKIIETTKEGKAHYTGREITITGGFTYRPLNYDDEIPMVLEEADHYHATDGETEYVIRDVRGWFSKQVAARHTGPTDTLLAITLSHATPAVYIHKVEILGYGEDNATTQKRKIKELVR